MTSLGPDGIFATNPYQLHPSLTPVEADVLWEYAKLAQHIKLLLAEKPDEILLARLRVLEKKMGLVLTLFKASVWGVINEQSLGEPTHSGYQDNSDDITMTR